MLIILIKCQGNYSTARWNPYTGKKYLNIYLSYNGQTGIKELSGFFKAPSKAIRNSELLFVLDWGFPSILNKYFLGNMFVFSQDMSVEVSLYIENMSGGRLHSKYKNAEKSNCFCSIIYLFRNLQSDWIYEFSLLIWN